MPTAAARCINPESLPTYSSHCTSESCHPAQVQVLYDPYLTEVMGLLLERVQQRGLLRSAEDQNTCPQVLNHIPAQPGEMLGRP